MVGVPGKSKGCITCRRRKIKCDEAKPLCERCLKSKVECQGYDRFPVFIDRIVIDCTKPGLRRRKPLEEAEPCAQADIVALSSPDLEAACLISSFWETFTRSSPSAYILQNPSHWLDHFIHNYSESPPLRHALLAVSVTRLGKKLERPDWQIEGRQLYTKSLGLTRRELSSQSGDVTDQMLATTSVMILYELFDSTNDNMQAWNNHLLGLSELLHQKGPKNCTTLAARAILEHSRYLIMLRDMFARKSSMFGRPEWLEEPWKGVQKTFEQQVFDQGLTLASLFERCDAMHQQHLVLAEAVELYQGCMRVYDNLEEMIGHDAPMSNVLPPTIANSAATLLITTALGMQLGACESAHDVMQYAIEPSITAFDLTNPHSWPERVFAEHINHLAANRRTLAKRIIQQMEACPAGRLGTMGSARLAFSVKLALRQFQPADAEYEQCKVLLERLSGPTTKLDSILRSGVICKCPCVHESTV